MANRAWRDIVADVLELAKIPTNKTTIMFKCVLSYDLLREYLALTQDAGLLKYDPLSRQYQTTDKGLEYLKLFGAISDLVNRKNMVPDQSAGFKKSYMN